MATDLQRFMSGLKRRNPGEKEFHQAVEEVAADLIPFIKAHPKYDELQILERLTEPDRIISFRVCWQDDQGNVRTNRGFRVQHNNAIGPYKGGLRFHKSVNRSILKFLAFEQTFKNSLTGLPMGGAKGGSDFNPKDKSEHEIMRFCQAFMTELYRHIGPYTDVPAGDIGVGAREVSYLFGQYKRISNQFTGTITGKGLAFGGSLIRAEATGYGAVYLLDDMLQAQGQGLEGKSAVISGSGNVATHAAEKLIDLGARVLTLSDSSGFVYDKAGMTQEKIDWIKDLKERRRGRIKEYADEFGAEYHEGARPWGVTADLALPCATQNELNEGEAKTLVANGCIGVSEGANMPSTLDAIHVFQNAGILYAPSKAANAGGVAVSGLEMTQNSMRLSWSKDELLERLRKIMAGIHEQCALHGRVEGGRVDYVKGANVAGFIKVADAMAAYGVI
ncbi:NADP-specific glutamate dehydrogenase [uncultured Abyssibacter sp.]|uniref:NADP-specific glutamate dehydrogenase n=1 Tax=uncultured Abyssibacter sp. TaxID=2320202 RepID=UPI0032B17763